MQPDPSMLKLARDAAVRYCVDAALVCAVIEQESGWDTNAMRYEGGFRARYVTPLGLPPTEEIARSISWGLMQVMGQVAREHGFAGKFLSALCTAERGVDVGCAVLADKVMVAERQVGGADAVVDAGPSGLQHTNCMSVCRTATLGCVTLRSSYNNDRSFSNEPSERRVWTRALSLWNGGANVEYPGQVLSRLERYR